MKRFLYIMPAVLILMLYALLTALAGGVSGFQSVAFVNMGLPLAAGILLRKGKWWGCLFGVSMGALLLFNSAATVGVVIAVVLMGYYAVMGVLCAVSQKKQ